MPQSKNALSRYTFLIFFAVVAKRMTNLESDESLEPNGLHIIVLHNIVIESENTLKTSLY